MFHPDSASARDIAAPRRFDPPVTVLDTLKEPFPADKVGPADYRKTETNCIRFFFEFL